LPSGNRILLSADNDVSHLHNLLYILRQVTKWINTKLKMIYESRLHRIHQGGTQTCS
jgi:hypothetical protein